MKKTNNSLLWILQVLLAVAFLGAGIAKLSSQPAMVDTFDQVGAGQWLRFFIGGVEVFAASLLVIPGTAGLGAQLLVGTMFGALCTHFFIIGGNPLPAIALLGLAAVIAWGRQNRITAPRLASR